MFRGYLLVFFLGHILGDYYFQSEKLAQTKNQELKKLMLHNLIYLATNIVVILPVFSYAMLLSAIILSLIHASIDFIKYLYLKYLAKENISVRMIFAIDQVLHITCLILAAYVLTIYKYEIKVLPVINDFFIVTKLSKIKILSWLIMVLFIFKPANITIKQILLTYKSVDRIETNNNNDKKAGSYIGSLERLIILMFLLMNQFSAIGLVLTAKSVARYNKISEDRDFAEYYLLGTLLSTVLVIIIFVVV